MSVNSNWESSRITFLFHSSAQTNCLPYFPYPARLRYTNPKVITVQEDVDPNDVFHPISVNPPDAESWENVNLSIGSSDSSDAENDQVRSPYNTESNSPELTSTDHLFHEPYLNLPTKVCVLWIIFLKCLHSTAWRRKPSFLVTNSQCFCGNTSGDQTDNPADYHADALTTELTRLHS